jgi:hypothetical protein
MLSWGLAAGWAFLLAQAVVRAGTPSALATAPKQTDDAGVSVGQKGQESASTGPAPSFRADVQPLKAGAGEPVTVKLTVTNHGRAMLYVPDPRSGGHALQLRLAMPTGEVRTVNVGDRPGGVKSRLVNIGVRPKASETVRFDLGERAPIGAPGKYVLSLDYVWKPDQHWRSPELTFQVTAR